MLEKDRPLFPLPPGRDEWEQRLNCLLRGVLDSRTNAGGIMVIDRWCGPSAVGVLGSSQAGFWLFRADLGAFELWHTPPCKIRVERHLQLLNPDFAASVLAAWEGGLQTAGSERFSSRLIGGFIYRFTVWSPQIGVLAGAVDSSRSPFVGLGLALREMCGGAEQIRTNGKRAALGWLREINANRIVPQ